MKGKSYSIPVGMVFKKYYCSKCGERLKKERTHRVVTKEDKDYYRYHDYGSFPRYDHDVYDQRFQCPSCEARISFNEQCIIERIQKKRGRVVLSPSEIKQDYKKCKQSNSKRVLLTNILVPLIFIVIFFICAYFFSTDEFLHDLRYVSILFLIFALFIIVSTIRAHKGNYKWKVKYNYSYEKESLFEKLQAYSSHNKKLVESSEKCYCFYCKSIMSSRDIKGYIDDGKTAICPICGIDSIIPDGIDETVDENILSEMHEYWF